MRDAKETPEPEVPPHPLVPPKRWELAQENIRAGAVNVGQPDVEAARALLLPMVAGAEDGIARREAWRAAPVLPRADLEDFPPYDSLDELLTHASKQRCPLSPFWGEFDSHLKRVQGHIENIDKGRKAIASVATLKPEDCQRPEHFRPRHWPPDCRVERLANVLGGLANLGRDRLDDDAHALAASLDRLLRWSRNASARPAMTREPEVEDSGRMPTVFDPRP